MTRSATVGRDLLRAPAIGRLLRWRHARTSFQIVLLLAAAVIVLHGLFGPQVAPANLATVLTWVHYRGLLVVALLAAGNFFCTGCPFVLVRDAGRRLRAPSLRWPRRLRTKWAALALFAAVLFAYELFDLWALPGATAWLVLGYFGAALAVDLTFTGATFCKYVCPIGQFSFAASTVSPLELRIREPETCRACRTSDCIRGRREPAAAGGTRIVQRGCELGLFLPAKVGNMDCTFCLDCVQACPYDNIAMATRVPGLELLEAGRRSGIGRFDRRPDIAALAVLFTFGGLLNAFGMVGPVYDLQAWLSRSLGGAPDAVVLALIFVAALGVAPLVLVGTAAAISTWGTTRGGDGFARAAGGTAVRYAYALLPFGFGVWLAHYGFHLLTGLWTIVPVTQRAVADALGWPALGEPLWQWAGMAPGLVFPIQAGVLVLGAAGSLALAVGISERDAPGRPRRAGLPWIVLLAGLCAAALWILGQPMEMRGMGGVG